MVTDVLVTANYSALSYQLAGQHKCCTETYQHHHHQAAYAGAGGLFKLTTKRCSFNIMCACGKSHHILKRIPSVFVLMTVTIVTTLMMNHLE